MTLNEFRTKRPEIYAIAFSDPVVVRHSVRVERLESSITASNETALRAAARLEIDRVEVEVLTRTINSLEREYKYRIERLKARLKSKQAMVNKDLTVRDMPADDRKAVKMTAISEAKARRDAILLALCNQLSVKPGFATMSGDLHFTGGDQ